MQEVHITLAMLPNGSITMHSERQCSLDTAMILFDAFALRDKFKEWDNRRDNKPTETTHLMAALTKAAPCGHPVAQYAGHREFTIFKLAM